VELERRLHQRHQVGLRCEAEPFQMRQRPGHRQIAEVEGDEVDRLGHERPVDHRQIVALEVDDARILPQPAAELVEADVDRVDAAGAVAQQRGGEAAGRGADVDRGAAAHGHGQRVEGIGQLHVTAQPGLGQDPHGGVGPGAGARVGQHPAVDQHAAGTDGGVGVDARVKPEEEIGERDERRPAGLGHRGPPGIGPDKGPSRGGGPRARSTQT
jgi:hypothetical protein